MHTINPTYVCVLAALAMGCGGSTGGNAPEQQTSYQCTDSTWSAGTCDGGTTTEQPDRGGEHVAAPTHIDYEFSPPASGPHRPEWGRWGEYSYLPPQRWVHNLEHGGIVLLYNPCVDKSVVDKLHAFAAARPGDDGGEFRWVLTPYPGLKSAVAVVAWDWVYEANCVDPDAIEAFVKAHYRKAPEDAAADGTFRDKWLGR